MNETLVWHNETIGKKVVEALIKNRFKAEYVSGKEEALAMAMSLISQESSVGMGGSASNIEIGLEAALKKRGNKIIDWKVPGFTAEQQANARRDSIIADVFITSSNAITLAGELINIDGTGNRVAAMTFGPKKVIVVAGINKIVPDIDSAIKRIQTIAAPANNKRLARPNPCTQTGVCMNCNNPTRICNVTTIMHKCPSLSDITIIIVGDNLGF